MRALSPLLLICALAGCCLPLPFDRLDDAPPPAPRVASAPPPAPIAPRPAAPVVPAAPAVPREELEASKISGYSTDCLNRFSERVYSSRERYLSWADEETGPTGRERIVYGLYTIYDPRRCRAAVGEAARREPSMPDAERAAEAYAAAVERLYPLLARADRYYERETWRDDDMAGGRQMHAELLTAYEAFASADRDLRREVEAVQDRARAARLVALAADPARRAEYLVERTMDQALRVLRLARDLDIEGGRYVAEDPAAFVAAAEALRGGVDELLALPPERGGSSIGGFREGAEELLEATLTLMRRVRDGDRLTRSELSRVGTRAEWMTDGSYGQLQGRYNRLVDIYNRMD